jgi:hypothetical protein
MKAGSQRAGNGSRPAVPYRAAVNSHDRHDDLRRRCQEGFASGKRFRDGEFSFFDLERLPSGDLDCDFARNAF